MMPRVDGFEVCRRMRAAGDRTPVLVLTARDGVSDRVKGSDAGADDYLVKPFALDELLARAACTASALRRGAPGQVLRFSDLTLDPVAHQVTRGDREIELTRTEFLLLELFMLHPRQVLTRSVIFERVWGYDFGPDSNSLEVYVSYLRRKLEAADEPRLLHTVRGVDTCCGSNESRPCTLASVVVQRPVGAARRDRCRSRGDRRIRGRLPRRAASASRPGGRSAAKPRLRREAAARGLEPADGQSVLVLPAAPLGSAEGYAQIVRLDGTVIRPQGQRVALPVDQRTLGVAAGTTRILP
jgi:two-component system response regulator MprA